MASCNKQDFKNLVDVYLDACFHPNVLDPERGPEILKQEGRAATPRVWGCFGGFLAFFKIWEVAW